MRLLIKLLKSGSRMALATSLLLPSFSVYAAFLEKNHRAAPIYDQVVAHEIISSQTFFDIYLNLAPRELKKFNLEDMRIFLRKELNGANVIFQIFAFNLIGPMILGHADQSFKESSHKLIRNAFFVFAHELTSLGEQGVNFDITAIKKVAEVIVRASPEVAADYVKFIDELVHPSPIFEQQGDENASTTYISYFKEESQSDVQSPSRDLIAAHKMNTVIEEFKFYFQKALFSLGK